MPRLSAISTNSLIGLAFISVKFISFFSGCLGVKGFDLIGSYKAKMEKMIIPFLARCKVFYTSAAIKSSNCCLLIAPI